MKSSVYSLNKEEVGSVELDENIFGVEIRQDLIKLVIDWQLAKRQAGTHKTKTITEVSGTTKKPFKQKGTGKARQGSLRSVQMRGGGISHGPLSRSHAFDLNKKVRRLGLIHALAAKQAENKLFIVKDFEIDPKSKVLSEKIKNFSEKSVFAIDGDEVNPNFKRASGNLHYVNVVPQIGANVYDIIKHDCVVLSEAALKNLSERLLR